MKISLRSSGGFTGPAGATTRSLNLDELPDERRREGLALIEAANLFDRPPKSKLAAPRPWDFNQVLEVTDGDRVHRIEFHLDAVDDSLRALVDWIDASEPGKDH